MDDIDIHNSLLIINEIIFFFSMSSLRNVYVFCIQLEHRAGSLNSDIGVQALSGME